MERNKRDKRKMRREIGCKKSEKTGRRARETGDKRERGRERKRELESWKTEKRDRETFRWAVGEKSKGLAGMEVIL
jgi:hypothetical protein